MLFVQYIKTRSSLCNTLYHYQLPLCYWLKNQARHECVSLDPNLSVHASEVALSEVPIVPSWLVASTLDISAGLQFLRSAVCEPLFSRRGKERSRGLHKVARSESSSWRPRSPLALTTRYAMRAASFVAQIGRAICAAR